MSDRCVIKLVGLATGARSEFDGKYVVEYDPARVGHDSHGRGLRMHLVVTDDIHKATQFDFMDAWKLWKSEHGKREDGRPNRPLTAFHVTFPNAPMVESKNERR